MSTSLDGYIADPDDRQGQELGDGRMRVFNRLADRASDGPGLISGHSLGHELLSAAACGARSRAC